MNHPSPTKVIFVTPFWGNPRTGPEVYAKYLWESFRDDPDLEFHLVAAGEEDGAAHPRLHLIKHPGSSLALFKAVAHRALELTKQLGPRGILHVNNSNFHHSLLGSAWPIIGQINDYEAANFLSNALDVLRKQGFRRFLSLGRRAYLERKFVRRQALTLCNSDFTRSRVRSAYGMQGDRRMRVVYKAVDVAKFLRLSGLVSPALAGKQGKIVFVGADYRRKGLDTLVSSLRHLSRPVRLRVVGVLAQDFERSYPGLCALAGQAGSVVEFLGYVERAGIPPILWDADVFCMPSRDEALGVALLEAVAAGLPCVAADVGGIPEIARHFASVSLVPPEEPLALARALDRSLSRGAPPTEGDKISILFGRETMVRAIAEIYYEVAARTSQADAEGKPPRTSASK